jgi:hypothetical protein
MPWSRDCQMWGEGWAPEYAVCDPGNANREIGVRGLPLPWLVQNWHVYLSAALHGWLRGMSNIVNDGAARLC